MLEPWMEKLIAESTNPEAERDHWLRASKHHNPNYDRDRAANEDRQRLQAEQDERERDS